jgi:hypothetical protein
MKTATFVKRMTKGFVGIAELYKCEPPMEEIDYDYDKDAEQVILKHAYVVVSAASAFGSGPETYIFGADANGNVVSWLELDGSFRGDYDIPRALQNAGYTIIKEQ